MVAKAILFAVLAVLAGAIPITVSNDPRFLLDGHHKPHHGTECVKNGHKGLIDGTLCVLADVNLDVRSLVDDTVVSLDGQLNDGVDLLTTATAAVDVSGKHGHVLLGREPLLGLGQIGGKGNVVADVLANVTLADNEHGIGGLVAGVKAKVGSSLLSEDGNLLAGLHLRDIAAFNSINAGLDAKIKHGLNAQADVGADAVVDLDALVADLLHVKGSVEANAHARRGVVATALADVDTNLGLDHIAIKGAADARVKTGSGLLHADLADELDADLGHLLGVHTQDKTNVHLRRYIKADAAGKVGLSLGEDVALKGATAVQAKVGPNLLAHVAGDLSAKVGDGLVVDGQGEVQGVLDDLHVKNEDALHATVHGRAIFAHTAGDLDAKLGDALAVDTKGALNATVEGLHLNGNGHVDAKVHARGLLAHVTGGLEAKLDNGLLVSEGGNLNAAVKGLHLGVADDLRADVHARDVNAQVDAGIGAQLGSTLKTAVQADAGVHLGEGALALTGNAQLKAEIAQLKAQIAVKESLLVGRI